MTAAGPGDDTGTGAETEYRRTAPRYASAAESAESSSSPGTESGSGTGTGAGTGAGAGAGTGTGSGSGTGPAHAARPVAISSGLSLVAGLAAILLVANASGQVLALGVTLGGTVVLASGFELHARGHSVAGKLLFLGGLVGVAAGLSVGVTGTATVDDRVEVLPGLLGIALLGTGLGSGVRGYERWFVSAGSGVILGTVVVSGMLQDASVWAMFAATAATYVAWDCGEQAINVGEQVGRQARTREVELVHAGVATLVAGVGVVMALGFASASVGGMPLLALTAVLLGAAMLAAGLFV